MLRRLQRCLLQVANLGTSSSRKTFILVADVTLETFNGTVPMEESVVTSAKALKVGRPKMQPPIPSTWALSARVP